MQKLLLYIVTCLLLCSLPLVTWAQRLPFTFDQLKLGDDAVSNQVNCLLKDRNGYIWMGTAAGLKRYDPVYTASFRKKKNDTTSLISNNVLSLCEDLTGRIWVATSEGVCYYDRKRNSFTWLAKAKKKGGLCNNILCAYNGDIWFSSVGGMYRYEMKTGQVHHFSPSTAPGMQLSASWVATHGLAEDPGKKGLWIACANGLNFYDYAAQKIYNAHFNPHKIKVLTPSYTTATVIHKGKLVFADNDAMQIRWYDLQTNVITDSLQPRSLQGYPLFYVLQLFFDSSDNLWLSTADQRAAYINMKERKVTDIVYQSGRKNSFSSDKFTDVLQEQNHTLWFATANGITNVVGLDAMHTNDKLFEVYDFSKKLFSVDKSDDYITGITEDAATHNWWIVTGGNRLINYDPHADEAVEWKVPSVTRCINYEGVHDVYDYQKKLLLFKSKAFYIFDKAVKTFTTVVMPGVLKDCEKFQITHTKLTGDSVWMFVKSSTNTAYCYNLITAGWSEYSFVQAATMNSIDVSFSCVTQQGELIVAVNKNGLAKLSPGKKQFEFFTGKRAADFAEYYFTGLVQSSKGDILYSNQHELMKWVPSANQDETILEADFIGAIAVGHAGSVCYASLDNLVFYNEKNNEKVSFQFEVQDVFHQPDNKLVNLSGGKVISLQKKQLLLVDFKEIHMPSFADQPYINHIFTADTSILIHENNSSVRFSSLQNSFTVDFGMSGPPNTTPYEFSYRLEGFDDNWIEDTKSKHSATYGNLDGGDYVFVIKAVDLNMKALPEQRLYIHIDTVFYKTKWFIALMGALLALAVILFYRYRLNKEKQILQLEKKAFSLEKEKTQVQYENLKQQLNPHFLFNSLSSLRSLIRMNPALATDFLDGLSKTYRYLLRSGDSELVSMQEEINFVQTFIQLQKTRFEEGLQLKIDLPDHIMSKQIAPVTIQGLIENAIKHNTIEEDAPLVIAITDAGDGYIAVSNNLQRYRIVETSNKKGLEALKTLYHYLTDKPVLVEDNGQSFTVKIPLI